MDIAIQRPGYEFEDSAFALAMTVLYERIHRLPEDDRNDLYELIPDLFSDDTDVRESAVGAVREILDQEPLVLRKLDLDENVSDLEPWLQFVSKRIREERKAAGLTQQELAEKAELPQPYVSKLENGKHSPTAMTLEKIANALDKPVGVFDPTAE